MLLQMRDVEVLHIPVTTRQCHTQTFVTQARFQRLHPSGEAEVVSSIPVAIGRYRILPNGC
jgi:hypothetical protein